MDFTQHGLHRTVCAPRPARRTTEAYSDARGHHAPRQEKSPGRADSDLWMEKSRATDRNEWDEPELRVNVGHARRARSLGSQSQGAQSFAVSARTA